MTGEVPETDSTNDANEIHSDNGQLFCETLSQLEHVLPMQLQEQHTHG
jgi:hypothetical protein